MPIGEARVGECAIKSKSDVVGRVAISKNCPTLKQRLQSMTLQRIMREHTLTVHERAVDAADARGLVNGDQHLDAEGNADPFVVAP